jgi:serine/threonine protein kinase
MYLNEVAEVLDVLNHEHGLQHLDVKPRNLFLVGRHVQVADFGLLASPGRRRSGESELDLVPGPVGQAGADPAGEPSRLGGRCSSPYD